MFSTKQAHKKRSFLSLMVLVLVSGTIRSQKAESSTASFTWDKWEVITEENFERLSLVDAYTLAPERIRYIRAASIGSDLYIAVAAHLQVWLLRADEQDITGNRLETYSYSIQAIEFDPTSDHLFLATGGEGNQMWDVASQTVVQEFGLDSGYHGIAFSPLSGNLFLVIDDKIQEWELSPLHKVDEFLLPGAYFLDVDVSSSSPVLAVGTHSSAFLLDWETKEETDYISYITTPDVVFNHQGTIAAYFTDGGYEFGMWEIATRSQLISENFDVGSNFHVRDIRFSPNDQLFVLATPEGLRIYNGMTGEYLDLVEFDGSEVTAIEFSPDGKFLITGHENGQIKMWGVSEA